MVKYCSILVFLLGIFLSGCGDPNQEELEKSFPLGSVVAFVSAPDTIIGHVCGYSALTKTTVWVRILKTGEKQRIYPNELIIYLEGNELK